ncbi:MAG TPA: hypothetical protein VEG44_07775 [Candidatus Acidoferrales bacterium]|nr:hypothetical protein [Candidatus Acidoferrales bacterium]
MKDDFISHIGVKKAEFIEIRIGVRGNCEGVRLLVARRIGIMKKAYYL